ncbi:MAG: BlaI/MecI/CopY family transcriptional regulator [Candidatus Poribacteria bacterium]|nr:BlaI/MecI/CopY family transcriptional regulator [Candidatus Poribacteria bacterium]
MQSQRLHRLDLEVMKVVWKLGQATVNDVRNALKQPLAYTSVATTLSHLERKGFLTHDVDGRTYVYRPLVQESDVSKTMLGDLLERLFDGSVEQLVNTLLESRKIPSEELERVQELINTYQEEHDNG